MVSPMPTDPDDHVSPSVAVAAPWTPRAIAFDAFGTLVEIRDRRRPYHRFSRLARSVPGARDPLVTDVAMADWARALGASSREIAEAEADLAAEVASVSLRAWAGPAWDRIRAHGLRIAVCSNLASPYGPALLRVLPDEPDATVLSYESGLRKPDPAIYALVAETLTLDPGDILFVGDTPAADVDGPRAAGMRSLHVDAFEMSWVLAFPPAPFSGPAA